MKEHESHAESLDRGWYVCRNSEVFGPMTAQEASAFPGLQGDTQQEATTFLSRKGFSKWYPLRHLLPLLQQAESLDSDLHENLHRLESIVATHLARYGSSQGTSGAQQQALLRRTVGPSTVAPASEGRGRAVPTAALPTPAPREDAPPSRSAAPSQRPTLNLGAGTESFLLRSQLRLGKSRNPWTVALFWFPLTLGFGWYDWFRRVAQEVLWHIDETHILDGFPNCWLAAIPGVHVAATYKLARLIRTMEEQNRYQSCRPALAAFLAILPPLAEIYLQRRLNQHWQLHLDHGRRTV